MSARSAQARPKATRNGNATKAPRPDRPELTAGELRDAIRAGLRYWFPHCRHAALLFSPGPGQPPLVFDVVGQVIEHLRLQDEFYSEVGGGHWDPEDEVPLTGD